MSAGVQKLKSRIKSAKNIAQITKAMEMVSAAKMRKAQERALQSKPYAEALGTFLQMLGLRSGQELSHPLLQQRSDPKKALVVIFTSDKGLAGSFHANIFRQVSSLEKKLHKRGLEVSYVAQGRKGRDFLRYTKRQLVAVFDTAGDHPSTATLRPLVDFVQSEFSSGKVDEVYIVYSDFISTLVQKPAVQQLLPFHYQQSKSSSQSEEKQAHLVPIFEPERSQLLDSFLPYALEYMVYKTLLQNLASEHSARMIAMKNAHDNAKEIGKDLLLAFNQIRQATITQQINEISGASMATYQ